jgi:hypothetical protein
MLGLQIVTHTEKKTHFTVNSSFPERALRATKTTYRPLIIRAPILNGQFFNSGESSEGNENNIPALDNPRFHIGTAAVIDKARV